MRFEVVNGQFGFLGKTSDRVKIEKAINALLNEINSLGCIEDHEYMDKIEISYGYDMEAYTVRDIHFIWRKVKKTL